MGEDGIRTGGWRREQKQAPKTSRRRDSPEAKHFLEQNLRFHMGSRTFLSGSVVPAFWRPAGSCLIIWLAFIFGNACRRFDGCGRAQYLPGAHDETLRRVPHEVEGVASDQG